MGVCGWIKAWSPIPCSQHRVQWPGTLDEITTGRRQKPKKTFHPEKFWTHSPLAHRPAMPRGPHSYHCSDGTKDGRRWPVVTLKLGTRWKQDPTSILRKHVEIWIIHVFSGWLYIHVKPISFANSTCLSLTMLKICFPKKPYPTIDSTKYRPQFKILLAPHGY